MKAIQIISQDVFDKVRSRFSNLEMGDETGAVTIDPAEARFFDFDFVQEGNNLGRVSISLNDLGSLKIYYSQGITENQDDLAKQMWYSFLKEMRMFAMRRLLRFDTRDIAKTNLDKNDFQHLAATQGPKDDDMTNTMNESRWSQKSTKKTSRAVKGTTEVIVRHNSSMDEMYPGARSQRKNIKAIFIQNKEGERFKYPFIHPAGAFAMAQHVDHGGAPYDPAGKAIIKMSEQIAQLQEFQRKIQKASLHDDAMGITDRAVGRLQELKNCVECLGKRHHYQAWIAEFNEQQPMDDDIMELDAVTMEDYKSKFTETNFKEELAGFFPLLHSIMREANKVNLEDYVKEESDFVEEENEVKENSFEKFEEWAEATEQGKLADDQIQALKAALADTTDLQLGPDGQTAWQFFNGLGIEDSDLEDNLKSAASLDSTADPVEVFKMWAQESYPELLVALGMSDTQAPAEPAPEVGAEPNPMPAPEQPVGEGLHPMVIADIEKLATLNPADRYSAYSNIRGYFKADPELSKMASDLQGGYYEADMLRGKYKTDAAKAKYAELEPMHQAFIKQAHGAVENTDMVPPPGAMEEGFDPAAQDYSDWLDITRKETMRSGETDGANSLEIMANNGDDITDVIRNILAYVKQNSQELGREVSDETGKTVKDAIIDIKNNFPQQYQAATQPQGVAEGEEGKGSMVQEVAKIVKSFYNRDNPEVGPFRGEEGIVIDVEKQISEKFGEAAGQQAGKMAEAFMAKLTQEWQAKHGQVANGQGDDGLARLKELLGNVKAKVEGIGDQGPVDKNIMSAEEEASHQTKTTMKHADNPTYQQRAASQAIKPGIPGYQDRIDMLKDLERTGKLKKEDLTAFEDIMRLAGLAK